MHGCVKGLRYVFSVIENTMHCLLYHMPALHKPLLLEGVVIALQDFGRAIVLSGCTSEDAQRLMLIEFEVGLCMTRGERRPCTKDVGKLSSAADHALTSGRRSLM